MSITYEFRLKRSEDTIGAIRKLENALELLCSSYQIKGHGTVVVSQAMPCSHIADYGVALIPEKGSAIESMTSMNNDPRGKSKGFTSEHQLLLIDKTSYLIRYVPED